MKTASLIKIYIAIGFIYLLLLLLGNEALAWFLKPILLPPLIAGVAAWRKFGTKNILLFALLFSWLGDIVLMFADHGELFFIIGLVLFLTAHVLYIVLFHNAQKTGTASGNAQIYIGLACIVCYLIAMLYMLLPDLGSLKIPVAIYAIVISTMLFMAVRMTGREKPAKYYILAGAICFVVSDSLLAFDKFHDPIPLASFSIMSTYLAAQLLIAFGILALNKKEHAV